MFNLNDQSAGEPDTNSLRDLLARHVDALNAGTDTTPALVREYEDHPSMAGLLQLARELHTTMIPVKPSTDFIRGLHRQLEQSHARYTRSERRRIRRRRWVARASRAFGAAVSLLAVIGLAFRVLVSFVMLIMLIARQKQRSATAA